VASGPPMSNIWPPVRLSAVDQSPETSRGVVLLSRKDMGVDAESDLDALVPQTLRDDVRRDAGVEVLADVGVGYLVRAMVEILKQA